MHRVQRPAWHIIGRFGDETGKANWHLYHTVKLSGNYTDCSYIVHLILFTQTMASAAYWTVHKALWLLSRINSNHTTYTGMKITLNVTGVYHQLCTNTHVTAIFLNIQTKQFKKNAKKVWILKKYSEGDWSEYRRVRHKANQFINKSRTRLLPWNWLELKWRWKIVNDRTATTLIEHELMTKIVICALLFYLFHGKDCQA